MSRKRILLTAFALTGALLSIPAWALDPIAQIDSHETGSGISEMRFSPDGRYLAAVGGAEGFLWDVKARDVAFRFPKQYFADSLQIGLEFLPERNALLLIRSTTLTALDFSSGKVLFEMKDERCAPSPDIFGLSHALSADGKSLLSGHLNGLICRWDLKTQKLSWVHRGNDHDGDYASIDPLLFSPDGRFVAAGVSANIPYDRQYYLRILDAEKGRTHCELRYKDKSSVHQFRFVPNTNLLIGIVSPSNHVANDNVVRVWNAESCKEVSTLPVSEVGTLELSPEGDRVALGTVRGSVYLWDFARSKVVADWKVTPVPGDSQIGIKSITFSPSGKYMVFSTGFWLLQLWDAVQGNAVFYPEPYTSSLRNIPEAAFSPSAEDPVFAVTSRDGRFVSVYRKP